jgi:hypothetical protein
MSLPLSRALPFASALVALSARALLAAICLGIPGLTLVPKAPPTALRRSASQPVPPKPAPPAPAPG